MPQTAHTRPQGLAEEAAEVREPVRCFSAEVTVSGLSVVEMFICQCEYFAIRTFD